MCRAALRWGSKWPDNEPLRLAAVQQLSSVLIDRFAEPTREPMMPLRSFEQELKLDKTIYR